MLFLMDFAASICITRAASNIMEKHKRLRKSLREQRFVHKLAPITAAALHEHRSKSTSSRESVARRIAPKVQP